MDKNRQFQRQNDFIAEKYDRFSVTFPKGKKEVYRQLAESKGMSLNAFINKLLEENLNK